MSPSLLVLAFLLSAPVDSFSASCEAVDLRPRIGAPMHQGDSGYCFAHSASSLIEAKLGFRVSPMQLAAAYLLTNAVELSAPAAPPALRELLTPELFDFWRQDRSSEPENYLPERILTGSGLLDTGGEELPTLLAANFTGLCPERRLPTGEKVYENYLYSIARFHEEQKARGQLTREPIGEVSDPGSREMAWSFRRWVEGRCGERIPPAEPLLPETVSLAPDLASFRALALRAKASVLRRERHRVMEAIDRQLDRGGPVAIGYALADLFPEGVRPFGKPPLPSPEAVDHSSVIAARRMIKGRCHYFVRNSFGSDLSGYAPKFRGRLEDGGAWVLPEELPSLYSAVWLRIDGSAHRR